MSRVRVMWTYSTPITVGLMIHWQAAFLVQWTCIYFLTPSEILLLSDHLVIEIQSSMEEWHCSPSSSSSISALASGKKKKGGWEGGLEKPGGMKCERKIRRTTTLHTYPSEACLLCLWWDLIKSFWKSLFVTKQWFVIGFVFGIGLNQRQ